MTFYGDDTGLSAKFVRDPVTEQAELSINMGRSTPPARRIPYGVTLDGERVVDVLPHMAICIAARTAGEARIKQITTFLNVGLRRQFQ